MGREVAEASARARAVFDRAGDLLGFDVAGLCFNGPAEKLEKTDIQQPTIFVVGVAIWEGGRGERAGIKAISGDDWIKLDLEAATETKA